jgi:hypothetical protein
VYLPLRSNAAAVVAGAPGRALIDRVKVVSLFFDDVLVQGGGFDFTLGIGAGIEGPLTKSTWTSGGERSRRTRSAGDPQVISPDGVIKSTHVLSGGHYWRATFEPLLRDLGRSFSWLHVADFALSEQGNRMTAAMLQRILPTDPKIRPVPLLRSVLSTETTRDLVTGAGLGAVMAADGVHQDYVRELVNAHLASPVPGPAALWIACPNVAAHSWEDLDAARSRRGMRQLRAILAEIEIEARDNVSAGSTHSAVSRALVDRLLAETQKSGLAAWLGAARRGAISTVLGLTPIGIPITIGSEAIVARRETGTWMAALQHLRQTADQASAR